MSPTLSGAHIRVLLACALVLGPVVGVATLARYAPVPVDHLTRDPAQVCQTAPLTGVVSYAGVLLWCAGAAVALFAGLLRPRGHDGPRARFLVGVGVVTALLCLDDLLQLHERVLPDAGVSEAAVLGAHAFLLAACLVYGWRSWRATEPWLLGLALGAFATSLALDALLSPSVGVLLEDSAKLVGISAWTAWLVVLAARALGPDALASSMGDGR